MSELKFKLNDKVNLLTVPLSPDHTVPAVNPIEPVYEIDEIDPKCDESLFYHIKTKNGTPYWVGDENIKLSLTEEL